MIGSTKMKPGCSSYYANCGAWCQGVAPTYIEDEYDEGSGTHQVSLKYCDNSTPDEVYEI